jgi:uncharacterized protein
VILLTTIKYEVPEVVTGLVGVGFIGLALLSSVLSNRRERSEASTAPELETVSV